MDATTASLIGGLVGGLISGAIAGALTLYGYLHGYFRLESNEKRLSKVRLVDDFVAYRFPLGANHATEMDTHYFNKTMARIPYVFGEDENVMEAFDEFMAHPQDTQKLVLLFRRVTEAAGIKDGLAERYISRVMTISPRTP